MVANGLLDFHYVSQSLKDQGKSRTFKTSTIINELLEMSQSLKDQGKSRTSSAWMDMQAWVAIP